jgi:DNA polymerase I
LDRIDNVLIVIDGNAMGHAHHNASKLTTRLESGKEVQTQVIYGYARMLRDLYAKHPGAEIVVLWDGRAKFRYELYPDYKASRKKVLEDDPKKAADRQAYYDQIPLAKRAVTLMGIAQVRNSDLEADDLAGWFCRRTKQRQVLLVTGDRDWWQLITPNVTWLDPRGEGKVVNASSFEQHSGYPTTEQFIQGKALMGDNSDSIAGVGGIGEKGAAKLIAEYGTVEAFFAKCDGGFVPGSKALAGLASPEGRAKFARNLSLMDLARAPDPDRTRTTVEPGAWDEEKLRTLCERLGFMSILRQWDSWITPFYARIERKAA